MASTTTMDDQCEPTLAEFGMATGMRPGSSKRKRSQTRDAHASKANNNNNNNNNSNSNRDGGSSSNSDGDQAPLQQGAYTPKRSRQSEWPLSEKEEATSQVPDVDVRQRSVRRKHGKYGLSSINKSQAQESEKGSKFLEGSMNDKPSIIPPSMFTRDISTHSLAISNHSINVDHLMDRYHEADLSDSIEQPAHFQPEMQQPRLSPNAATQAQQQQQEQEREQEQGQVSPGPWHFASPARQYASPVRRFASPSKPLPESPAAHTPGEHKGGLYRFGRMVASSFNPANMWGSFSRTFKDTKDEMTLRNIEENRKRALLKAEAEAKYSAMKAAGHFAKPVYTVVRNDGTPVRVQQSNDEDSEERNEHERQAGDERHERRERHEQAVIQEVLHDTHASEANESHDHYRNHHHHHLDHVRVHVHDHDDDHDTATASLAPPRASESTGPGSPALPSAAPVTLRSRKSIFGIRAPSLSGSIKRVRSEYSLLPLARQSHHSLSPDKQEQILDHTASRTLPRSQSKRELGKQFKLSKRVSDLELKLADARRELDSAINNASPLPDFPTRFEKFTPGKHTPTITSKFRSRFIPGKLPSLPSERMLFPEPPPQRSPDVIMELYTPAPRNGSIATQPPLDPEATSFPVPMFESDYDDGKPLPEPPIPDEEQTPSAPPAIPAANYDDLDARLKALDDHVEGRGKKKTASKTRKSDFDDKNYNPAHDTEGDDSNAPKKSKKRKSTSKTAAKKDSLESLHTPSLKQISTADEASINDETSPPAAAALPDQVTAADDCGPTAANIILSSDPLEPIYEEDSVTARTKHASAVLVAVHANVRSASRHSLSQDQAKPRPASPDVITQVSEHRPTSPQADHVIEESLQVTPVTVTVADMPNVSVRGRRGRKKQPKPSIENFQWPDDVF